MTATSSLPRVASLAVLAQLVRRTLLRIVRMPTILIPTIVMPAFFVVSFTGSFSGITRVEGYPTDNIVNWVAAFALLQSAAFAGIGSSAALAADLESRFLDRLLVSPIRRPLIVMAPLGQAVVRSWIPSTVVLLIAWAQDASMPGGVPGVIMAYVGGMGIAVITGSLGLTVILLIGNIRGMAIVQILVFALLFPSTGQVPIPLMDGWLADVARVNPATDLLALTRQGFLGPVTWSQTWPGLLVVSIGIGVFATTARLQLRRYDG